MVQAEGYKIFVISHLHISVKVIGLVLMIAFCHETKIHLDEEGFYYLWMLVKIKKSFNRVWCLYISKSVSASPSDQSYLENDRPSNLTSRVSNYLWYLSINLMYINIYPAKVKKISICVISYIIKRFIYVIIIWLNWVEQDTLTCLLKWIFRRLVWVRTVLCLPIGLGTTRKKTQVLREELCIINEL